MPFPGSRPRGRPRLPRSHWTNPPPPGKRQAHEGWDRRPCADHWRIRAPVLFAWADIGVARRA